MDLDLNFASVENIPEMKASAAFVSDSSHIFRDDKDITPVTVDDSTQYMPWGASNMLPFDILDIIESDETVSTCQVFNSEVCYGGGISYRYGREGLPDESHAAEIEEFFDHNDMAGYFLGVSQDFKFFGFAISVIILSNDHSRIVRIHRKEACYCRFGKADANGRIPYVLYANWRTTTTNPKEMEKITLLDPCSPLADLRQRVKSGKAEDKYAIVSRIPTVDSTYYPIPYYASLFKGKWFNIKRLIGIAKESKLRNSAPIKYQIEISNKYWSNIFEAEGITDRKLQRQRVADEKQNILDFLTGAENSGKVWFSMFYVTPDGKETHDVRINKIDSSKEGGDYESDIQEAINMICFTMRVHSNLVGSVPGKSQSNNSGSDKRELYTIAQALQKPYHDILFGVHRVIINFNGWSGFRPVCPLMQLTTLDEHRDIKEVVN